MNQGKTLEIRREIYDSFVKEDLIFKAKPGLNEELVRKISKDKNEPEWMLKKRLEAFEIFKEKPIPDWGPDLSELDLDEIHYYMRPNAKIFSLVHTGFFLN